MKNLLTFILLLLFSSNNYCNEMIDWTGSISNGTSIDSVKSLQPDFIVVDWDNPIRTDNETRYHIMKIKNNHDLLKMDNYLVFVNDKYQGRYANK